MSFSSFKKSKLLFENWRNFLREEESEVPEESIENPEENVLDFSQDLDSGFCTYNPLINEYAQYSPDHLFEVLAFVIATQRMKWYDVVPKFPILLKFIYENDGLQTEDNYLGMLPNKKGKLKPTWDYPADTGQLVLGHRANGIQYLWQNREGIYSNLISLIKDYNNSAGLRKEEALFRIYTRILGFKSFGLPKAAFATQLIVGRMGCIDSINLNIYKDMTKKLGILKVEKDEEGKEKESFITPQATSAGQRVLAVGGFDSDIIQLRKSGIKLAQGYVQFLRLIAKETHAADVSRKLWDSWVELVAIKLNTEDDIKVIMPGGTEHIVPGGKETGYSKKLTGSDVATRYRQKYQGKITGDEVSRQHHIPTMNESKQKQLFESWSKYFYKVIGE